MPYNPGSAIQRVTLVNAATDTDYNAGAGTAASPNVIVGNVASDAVDTGSPVKIGLRAIIAPTTVGDGDRVDAMGSTYGQIFAHVVGGPLAGGDGVSNANGLTLGAYANPAGAYRLGVRNETFNGTSWDRNRKPNVSKRIASSVASGNPDFLKASAGDLTKFWGLNGAAITYVQIYNKASAPTIGTDTPVLTYPVAALAPFDVTIPNGGLYFATGIAYAFTTDAAGTTGAAAAAVTSCNIIGA